MSDEDEAAADNEQSAADERAVAFACRALNARDRTVSELEALLERKGVGAGVISSTVEELREAGLLDDERYARTFADDKRELDRWGSSRIEQTLLRRGIPAAIAASAAHAERDSELGAALGLLEERIAPPTDDRTRQKAWQLLVRRGYEPDLAYEAVRAHAR